MPAVIGGLRCPPLHRARERVGSALPLWSMPAQHYRDSFVGSPAINTWCLTVTLPTCGDRWIRDPSSAAVQLFNLRSDHVIWTAAPAPVPSPPIQKVRALPTTLMYFVRQLPTTALGPASPNLILIAHEASADVVLIW